MTRLLFLTILLLMPLSAFASDPTESLQFAESLALEGDHYRAITEYKRFIFHNPESPQLPKARLAIAFSLLSGKRWAEADSSLETLFALHPQSAEALEGRRVYADSAYERGDFNLARERFRILQKYLANEQTINYCNFRIGWTFLEQDNPKQASYSFNLLPQGQRDQLKADLEGYLELEQKSPQLAGTLSALLPGAGQLYTGRPRQAAVSFLLNGAFILGAIEAFNNDNYAVGGILLFFETGWYGGNIYNAVNNAHKYNRRVKHDYLQQMRSHTNLQLGMLKNTPMVGINILF